MPEDELTARLLAFIRENFAPDDLTEPITEDSPLLELGILNSLKTAILLNFLRDGLGVHVPPQHIEAGNFRDVRAISGMARSLTTATGN